MTATNLIESVEDVSLEMATPRRVGGKGAGLVRLRTLGIRTAPAFLVSVDAFHHYVDSLNLGDHLRHLDAALAGDCVEPTLVEAIQQRMLAGQVPVEIIGEALENWNEWSSMLGRVPAVIVRSSATVEDSESHSYAGIFESLKIERRDQLEPAFRRIWASVFSPRAIAYYRMAKLRKSPAMALVVQEFVEADRSGVMFTKFGGQGDQGRLLIEHVEGSGEKLVSGAANPERLWVRRWPEAVSGMRGQVDSSTLDHRVVFSLVSLGRLLEEKLDGPQDVEWCAAGSTLFVVQTRPVTTPAHAVEAGRSPVGGAVVASGLGASGGRANGRVHLVHNIEDADLLPNSGVLVTPMTNPDMVTAMSKASAIVTDVGGMICHAAIVSRELSIPCVVGTENATTQLTAEEEVTVDGSAGRVYRGIAALPGSGTAALPVTWSDLWAGWLKRRGDTDVPLLTTIDALEKIPVPLEGLLLAPFLDLQFDARLHAVWRADTGTNELRGELREYFARVAKLARSRGIGRVFVDPLYLDDYAGLLEEILAKAPDISVLKAGEQTGLLIAADGNQFFSLMGRSQPVSEATANVRLAIPLSEFALVESSIGNQGSDGLKDSPGIFGRTPRKRTARMPEISRRAPYLDHVPALAASHRGHEIEEGGEAFEWLDLRPEVPITPMLKSLVLAGMESIPAAMGFESLAPMYVKWIRCRFHFREDTFTALWRRLAASAWDPAFMSSLLERTRASYERLEATAGEFPSADEDWLRASASELKNPFLQWWNAFVEFFSLSFFIQALGDDHMYPALVEEVGRNRKYVRSTDFAVPGVEALVAPTTPVMTAQYLADLAALGDALAQDGYATLEDALAAAAEPGSGIAIRVEGHLRRWHWMRERDPYYAPYDHPKIVLEKALGVGDSQVPNYFENARQGRLALSLHFELCHHGGDPQRLSHATGYGQGLALERENHHVVWLKCSYPFRRLCVEWERRLAAFYPLSEGDIFFMEAPEAMAAVDALPESLAADFVERIRNRRLAYETEVKLRSGREARTQPLREDDYY